MANENSFFGTGWGFPVSFDRESQSVVMASDVEDIKQSLNILLSTSLGERMIHPKYGSDLTSMLFEPVNNANLKLIEDIVYNAIIYYEARIDLFGVEVSDTEINKGVLNITVSFQLKGTNSRFNFVYPFYLNEGTDINLTLGI